MATLVLVRHGESLWNKENRFTGWVDVPLTANGENEAREAGKLIREAGIEFNVAYTSQLDRAISTLTIIMDELGVKLPVIKDYHLNERKYGDLQGLNKEETAKKYGQEQVHLWRRSYDVSPPGGESLEDTQKRTVPFFRNTILLDITQYKKNVLVVAHGNSLRSIVMYLENIKPEQIVNVEIPTGVPIVYLLDESGKVMSKRVLGKLG
ncbi:MAG: 2,3-bisphosphoglycerate-dependent phosphoglycerate mutase [Nitrososphaerota archaeon]|jgi:2,3-bisphosphoglycerate-dependent phosphoglycerate mutase|nr:2,3-bisphosphoglycerate-dependent phosphoglycerate mutase [Nitrososphaerota archaeon]MDG6930239.1 2,3-bisphosphoglycerate-dependent phosphoglycerate mutase [Nitrososphaerota archaeon]MDG6932637.1 2,3-bisphosphoglycerate-dependent phosphoglycerate mutase [Nitrososphaerota archaeon]MDG6935571.1 2,3-bisphosphoglycerate-dependent phosphoglycerate mutase [Nitrososphaerota archaeon]MDG6944015.1 2,3-bisphosphoglycerate-dependent phosphoglycerate mutase [Nitrososphaerota archaeon]